MRFKSVGVTGTRNGMTATQSEWVVGFLKNSMINVLHHGDCVGVDDQVAHLFARYDSYIIAHPGDSEQYRACCLVNDLVLRPSNNLIRNRHIVNCSEFMIAFPGTEQKIARSGTWHTIEYAKKQKKPMRIVTPSGQVIDPYEPTRD